MSIRFGPEMRVLIVGGGIAGLTLAGLLQQRGFRPVAVEKAPNYGGAGYVLGLFPAGSRILKGLGLYPQLEDAGVELARYEVANAQGECLHVYHFGTLTENYGPTLGISRTALIDVLRSGVSSECLRLGTTVESLTQTPDEAQATFSDGSAETFDLVVGCDGLRSRTRAMIFGDAPLTYLGMTGWGFWIPPRLTPPEQVTEYWGDGKFFGIYPVKDRWCAFTGVALPAGTPDPVETRIARIREHFADFGGLVPQILASLEHPEMMFHDDYNDVRLNCWHTGRVILIGDAAHAILPTGGLGASLAMESAAVLAEELCRADSQTLGFALDQYTVRRRKRVDKIQTQSRLYGKAMLLHSCLGKAVRDIGFRLLSEAQFFRVWENIMAEPL
ncbi:MAG: FAD-dependent monooxygenase [Armatimonadota bacterium]|nr:FAD-dependent monooxygenase [Armatimonadota bacterium]